ncbi:sulfite exporter TauE/SafE family protein [Sphingomonas bacterium]|uniref:sulfite exporter TauE/SafE family protein n=1 Tax=Sphingomonas bacterium TaxID=1895847 RepID=UPI0015758102|nr:sulfite exporter TauE/SafE family protein [Sphingomonas bacterium]
MIAPLYALAGALVGALVGLTGVGGGSLMTPLLVLAFGFHPATAVGTDLLFATATKTAGTGVHGPRGTVDWRVVRLLASGSLPACALTLLALQASGIDATATSHLITVTLGAVLILTGVATLFRARLLAWARPRLGEVSERRTARLTIALGLVLGTLVTLTSVGAGALGMTALVVLYPRLPVARLVGSDIAHAVPLTLLAGLGHLAMGSVDAALLLSLLCGSVPGVLVGSWLATRAPDRVLGPVLAVVLALAGWRLLA